MNVPRPSIHDTMMATANAWAARSTCSRLSVGAVLARDGMVLSTGYNGAPRGLPHCEHLPGAEERCKTAVHAEMNALIQAAYHGQSTNDATLYVTHEPCLACSGPIINAGVKEVRFEIYYPVRETMPGPGVERLYRAQIPCLCPGPMPVLISLEEADMPHAWLKKCADCLHTVAAHESGKCALCSCRIPVVKHETEVRP